MGCPFRPLGNVARGQLSFQIGLGVHDTRMGPRPPHARNKQLSRRYFCRLQSARPMAKSRHHDTEFQMSLMCGSQDTNRDRSVTVRKRGLLRCEKVGGRETYSLGPASSEITATLGRRKWRRARARRFHVLQKRQITNNIWINHGVPSGSPWKSSGQSLVIG